jgi:hypothetical protein
VGSEGCGMWCRFWDRRGRQGSKSACGRWRRRPVGLLEEEDGRPADRAGPPISEGEAAGQAGLEGGGRVVGRGQVRNRKWLDIIHSNFYLKFGFLVNFGNLHKKTPKEF